jgi:SAM-dependent methyltransferase
VPLACALATLLTAALTSAQLARRAPDVYYLPTPPAVVDAMLDLAGVGPTDVVYDLGSGDGRIVIRAAQKYGARGVGIEIDPALVAQATRNARQAFVGDRVRFFEGDVFEAEVSQATVVTLYLLTWMNERLQPKFRAELRPGARIVVHQFDLPGWTPDRSAIAAGRRVTLWTMPPRGN